MSAENYFHYIYSIVLHSSLIKRSLPREVLSVEVCRQRPNTTASKTKKKKGI